MKILIVGAGGIGSVFAAEVVRCVEHNQIDSMVECTIADDDIVELEQVSYQGFVAKDAGKNKADALAKQCRVSGVEWLNPCKKRITVDKQLKGYDIIILCVDNDVARRLVMTYCYKHDKEFLDLRAQGRNIMAMPKTTEVENLKFVSDDDTTYSCQYKADLAAGRIQYGNRIVALMGVQMLLNILRGQKNKGINMVV